MPAEPKIAIVVPAYNEEKNLKKLIEDLRTLRSSRFDVIIVNDCSTDGTFELASRLGCVVLDLPINLGIGGAVQTGIKYALENGYDLAVQVDGDGQHPPAEIPKLIKAINETQSDVVIGSRFIVGEGYRSTFPRRLGIRYFQVLLKLLTGQNITDATSGFRLLNKKAMALAAEYYPDEYPEPETALSFLLHGLKIAETPVIMKPRAGGESSIKFGNSVYYMVKVTLAIFFTFVKLKVWKI